MQIEGEKVTDSFLSIGSEIQCVPGMSDIVSEFASYFKDDDSHKPQAVIRTSRLISDALVLQTVRHDGLVTLFVPDDYFENGMNARKVAQIRNIMIDTYICIRNISAPAIYNFSKLKIQEDVFF